MNKIKFCKKVLSHIPSSWLDDKLSGKNNCLGDYPWGCKEIEKLLTKIRDEIRHEIMKTNFNSVKITSTKKRRKVT